VGRRLALLEELHLAGALFAPEGHRIEADLPHLAVEEALSGRHRPAFAACARHVCAAHALPLRDGDEPELLDTPHLEASTVGLHSTVAGLLVQRRRAGLVLRHPGPLRVQGP
jgi:hypothetical protein